MKGSNACTAGIGTGVRSVGIYDPTRYIVGGLLVDVLYVCVSEGNEPSDRNAIPWYIYYTCTSIYSGTAAVRTCLYKKFVLHKRPLSAVLLLRMAVALGTPERPAYSGHCAEATECSILTSWW